MPEELFNLSISSREGMVYEGKVKSITSYNNKGKFDILAYHANFISLISKEIIYIDISDAEHRIDIDSALLRLRDMNVEIYLGVKGISQENDETDKQEQKKQQSI